MSTEALAAPPAFVTKQDYAYERLYRAIVRGELEPGAHLRLDELGDRLGISRTPLREAVRRLQTEGLVVIKPHRGALVAGFSIRELVELYRIRAVLDGLAVRLATPALTEGDLWQLAALLGPMTRQDQPVGPEELNDLNRQFHDILYRRAASPILYEMITGLYDKTQRYRIASFKNAGRAAAIAVEHRKLYEALAAGDPAAAERCAIEHLENTAEALVRQIEEGSGAPWPWPEPGAGSPQPA